MSGMAQNLLYAYFAKPVVGAKQSWGNKFEPRLLVNIVEKPLVNTNFRVLRNHPP